MTGKGSFLKEGQLKTDRHSHEGPARKETYGSIEKG